MFIAGLLAKLAAMAPSLKGCSLRVSKASTSNLARGAPLRLGMQSVAMTQRGDLEADAAAAVGKRFEGNGLEIAAIIHQAQAAVSALSSALA
jgi:hypothetical protein